jgi:hypothetical protein
MTGRAANVVMWGMRPTDLYAEGGRVADEGQRAADSGDAFLAAVTYAGEASAHVLLRQAFVRYRHDLVRPVAGLADAVVAAGGRLATAAVAGAEADTQSARLLRRSFGTPR